MTLFAQLGLAAATVAVLDGVWLGVVAKGFYRRELGPLMRPKPDALAAATFYVLFVVAVVVLVVRPGLDAGRDDTAIALYGALLGAAAYGTYDLTNRATLRGVSWRLVAADMAWGTVLAAITAAVSAQAS